ncbi:MAG: AGE family epimerase/isomerase [Flavobacteriaceae bacterium]|nr:AGE family epimerase/isomerase [Flavobacteriaceae bacterium]
MQQNPEKILQTELTSELNNILNYWINFSVDKVNGGFIGERDHFNNEVSQASKGVVLNTRILWTFSAIGNYNKDKTLLPFAERAFDYLKKYFKDEKFKGIYWELDAYGIPINKRKQIYAQAFAIYALSEYYLFTKDENAKNWALSLFSLIEDHARDKDTNGYLEAFQEDWSPIKDMRLSEKDENAAITMNTHLHILEAYTSLLQICGNDKPKVKEALNNLVHLFFDKFLDKRKQHFQLFFDKNWTPSGNLISYGHDIEAIWLLIEAAKALKNENLIEKTREAAVSVAHVFINEAYVKNAGVLNEKDLDTGKVDTDRHWWPQAEAMVGLDYAFKISGEKKFRNAKFDIWEFIKKYIKDHENGEWFFRIDKNNIPYKNEDKLGMWKCPYHNSRACLILLSSDK